MMHYKAGDLVSGFRITGVRTLKEYRSVGIEAVHEATGCRLIKLANEDTEKLFAFSFRTLPVDSTGVAHILEHSVLSGSERYPLKDPFLHLMKGSMNTFLNAMTFPDKTLYPAASTVKQDYYNLMEVYGDAVFFPLLKPECFRQEGHRVEIEGDTLVRNGVVFNEMKGSYSSEESVAAEHSFRSLFPETSYGCDSGGDPRYIPDLTYEQFLDFHKKAYHPANCRIVLYGDAPLEEELSLLDDRFLCRFTAGTEEREAGRQKPFSKPLEKTVRWAADRGDDLRGTATISWVIRHCEDPVVQLAHDILEEILIGNSGAPFQKAVNEVDWADDLSPISGYEDEILEPVFTLAVRGIKGEDSAKLFPLIESVFKGLIREGIDADLVEASLRKVEFRSREISGGIPLGLVLARELLRGWNHGKDPYSTLLFEPSLKELRRRLEENPRYFESLLGDLMDNPHRSLVVTLPDPGLEEKTSREETLALKKRFDSLSAEDKLRLEAETEALRVFQETPDDPSVRLPLLGRSDLPRRVETIETEEVLQGDTQFYCHEGFTNGILYTDRILSLEDVPREFYLYLPLFVRSITGTGVYGESYESIFRKINLHTGGIGLQFETGNDVDDNLVVGAIARVKTLPDQMEAGLNLFFRILHQADFSQTERIRQIARKMYNQMKSSFAASGANHAILRSGAGLSESYRIEEGWRGLSQLNFLKDLLGRLEQEPKKTGGELASVLDYLRCCLLGTGNPVFHLAGAEEDLQPARTLLSGMKESAATIGLPSDFTAFTPFFPKSRVEGIGVSSGVNYVVYSFKAAPFGTPDYAHQTVLSHVLQTGPFWEKIRMKGGAYGAFTAVSPLEGVFSCASYRDPRLAETYEDFKASIRDLAENPLEREAFDTALVGLIGKEVRPMTPASKSRTACRRKLFGITDAMRQQKRDLCLSMTPEDLQRSAQATLNAMEGGYFSAVGGKAALSEAARILPGLKKGTLHLDL